MADAPQQGPGRSAQAPIGVVYNTSMTRPDAAVALAELYAFANKRESRVGAVCITGAGLGAAMFCDIVSRFFTPGPPRNSNSTLPIGLSAVSPLPPDPPMVKPAIDRKKETGEPAYVRSIRQVSDTSQAEAVLRNGVIFNAESVVVLSAPAVWLAKSLDLQGAKDQYKMRVKRLVIVDVGTAQADPVALRKVIAEWPSPVFYMGPDVGSALTIPGVLVEKAFAWTPAHPVLDAYRAFKPSPYDLPAHDVAAMHFVVHPDSEFFQVSEAGTLSVSDAGALAFVAGGGAVRRVTVDAARKTQAIDAFLAMAGAEPPPPPAPRGRGAQ